MGNSQHLQNNSAWILCGTNPLPHEDLKTLIVHVEENKEFITYKGDGVPFLLFYFHYLLFTNDSLEADRFAPSSISRPFASYKTFS